MLHRLTRPVAVVAAVALLAVGCADDESVPLPEVDDPTIASVASVGQRRPWDGMVLPPDAAGGPYGSPRVGVHLAELAQLGAPNVVLVVPLVQDEPTTLPAPAEWATPSPGALGEVLALARSLELERVVELRVEVAGDGEAQPRRPQRWFDRYGDLAAQYATVAADHDASLFVIDVPPGDLVADDAGWRQVIGQVRAAFDGPVALSVASEDLDRVGVWDEVDVIGVSVTFPDPAVPDPIAADIEKAWEPVMAELTLLADRWSRPVVLTRVGFPGVGRTTTGQLGVNEELQLGAYEALFTVANQTPAIEGVLVWRWGTDPATAGHPDATYSPQGRPAEEVLRRAWTTPLAGEEDPAGEVGGTTGADGTDAGDAGAARSPDAQLREAARA